MNNVEIIFKDLKTLTFSDIPKGNIFYRKGMIFSKLLQPYEDCNCIRLLFGEKYKFDDLDEVEECKVQIVIKKQ
jgi:hypothetical protein